MISIRVKITHFFNLIVTFTFFIKITVFKNYKDIRLNLLKYLNNVTELSFILV